MAPTISEAIVTATTNFTIRAIRPMPSVPIISPNASLERTVSPLPTSIARTVPNSMIPSPPIWMSPRMTAWPNGVKSVPVSRTTSPVTHVALVAVKRAST